MTTAQVLVWLKRRGSRKNVAGMARYGIIAGKAFGVSMATMRPLARRLAGDHALALALWRTGWHEARILAALIDDPAQVTRRQMDAWAADFDNWAVCDTTCLHLFDKTPHADAQVRRWAGARPEFVRRAAFALIAGLAVHDKTSPDSRFLPMLPLIRAAASDERPYVQKGVSWALRAIGHRSPSLHRRAVALARRLAASPDRLVRWVGTDVLGDLLRPAVIRRLGV